MVQTDQAGLSPPFPVAPEPGADPGDAVEVPARRSLSSRRARLLVGLCLAATGLPLAVALGVLRHPRWYPIGEMAQTEMRVRDVFSRRPPTIGLGGRIGAGGAAQGSHPGPLSFWSLAPVHRLLGGTAWSLEAATAVLHLIAMGCSLWIARRRGGPRLMLATAVALVVLAKGYGPFILTEPWNPYLPVMWWVLFVLAVWSLLCDDLPMLPVAVFAGTFCTQTHLSYVALVAAVGGTGAIAVLRRTRRRWGDRPARRTDVRWIVAGAALGVVLWSPPVAQQLRAPSAGNLGRIVLHFRDPPEEPIGFVSGLAILLRHLNPWRLVSGLPLPEAVLVKGSVVPGAVLLVVWLVAVAAAWRARSRALLSLHAVLAVAVAAGLASASRIFGPTFYYLTLWGWAINALLLLAVGWTALLLIERRVPAGRRPRLLVGATTLGVVALIVVTAQFAVDAAYVEPNVEAIATSMDDLLPETIAALSDEGAGRGRDHRYLVTWADPRYSDARGYVLFNELERAGFDVRADTFWVVPLTAHRTIDPTEATAEVHIGAGSDIEKWQAKEGFDEIARYDPATPDEREEYERLEALVAGELVELGHDDLVESLGMGPYELGLDARYSRALAERVARLLEIGLPIAVFVGPPPKR